MKRTTVTLTNDFHCTQHTMRLATVPLGQRFGGHLMATRRQVVAARRALCGSAECICGDAFGARPGGEIEVITETYYRETIIQDNRGAEEVLRAEQKAIFALDDEAWIE